MEAALWLIKRVYFFDSPGTCISFPNIAEFVGETFPESFSFKSWKLFGIPYRFMIYWLINFFLSGDLKVGHMQWFRIDFVSSGGRVLKVSAQWESVRKSQVRYFYNVILMFP